MRKRLIGGMKSAGLEKQIRIMKMFALFSIEGTVAKNARNDYTQETHEREQNCIQITATVVDSQTDEPVEGPPAFYGLNKRRSV